MGFVREQPDHQVTIEEESEQINQLMASLIRGRIFDETHHHHKKHQSNAEKILNFFNYLIFVCVNLKRNEDITGGKQLS